MELLCYLAVTLAMGGIAALSAWASDHFGLPMGPLDVLSMIASFVFSVMLLLLVVAFIVAVFGVEVET